MVSIDSCNSHHSSNLKQKAVTNSSY
jgi:hypothetical protein